MYFFRFNRNISQSDSQRLRINSGGTLVIRFENEQLLVFNSYLFYFRFFFSIRIVVYSIYSNVMYIVFIRFVLLLYSETVLFLLKQLNITIFGILAIDRTELILFCPKNI